MQRETCSLLPSGPFQVFHTNVLKEEIFAKINLDWSANVNTCSRTNVSDLNDRCQLTVVCSYPCKHRSLRPRNKLASNIKSLLECLIAKCPQLTNACTDV